MEFEKFVENVKETIKDYLPMEYENAIVDLYPHEKLNESYLGMTVRNENQNISPTLNLNMFYEQLQAGRFNLDQIMEQMAEVVQMTPMSVHMGLLTDYDFAKHNLFIRVSDADRNQEMLSNVPHTRVENLAITYHVLIESGAGGIASSIVNNDMMKLFGVSKEQLHIDALNSSPRLFPAHIDSCFASVPGFSGIRFVFALIYNLHNGIERERKQKNDAGDDVNDIRVYTVKRHGIADCTVEDRSNDCV